MAVLNLTPEEFGDIALLFLADKAVNPEKVISGDNKFNDFMKKEGHIFKGKLLKYYLEAPPERRREYKFIKKVFTGGDKAPMATIRIGPSKVIKGMRQEKSIVKKLIKKLTSKLFKKEDIEHKDIELLVEFITKQEVE